MAAYLLNSGLPSSALSPDRTVRIASGHAMQMSYNNYLDGDAAFSTACDFDEPTCVIVKHTNPCGVASRPDLKEAYRLAVEADPVSAFGGIVAFNRSASIASNCRQLAILSL